MSEKEKGFWEQWLESYGSDRVALIKSLGVFDGWIQICQDERMSYEQKTQMIAIVFNSYLEDFQTIMDKLR